MNEPATEPSPEADESLEAASGGLSDGGIVGVAIGSAEGAAGVGTGIFLGVRGTSAPASTEPASIAVPGVAAESGTVDPPTFESSSPISYYYSSTDTTQNVYFPPVGEVSEESSLDGDDSGSDMIMEFD